MFTGIIQSLGWVSNREAGRIEISVLEHLPGGPVESGESIAVNGCCLTVIHQTNDNRKFVFDVSPETLARTALAEVSPGSQVNLERAMKPSDLFGGHIVQGHVDATGEIVSVVERENSTLYRFQAPPEYDRYLIDKGSVSIDGISLTVVNLQNGQFDVWVVPHTSAHTNLGTRKPGDRVNMEFDVIAKYVEKLLAPRIEV